METLSSGKARKPEAAASRGVNAGAEVAVDRWIGGLRVAPVGVAAAVEEDACAATNRPFFESKWLPCKAKAWSKVGFLVVDEGMAVGNIRIEPNRDAFDLLQKAHIALGNSQRRQIAVGLRRI